VDTPSKKYHRRRNMYVGLMGGECAECGSKERLEFDHIHPEFKEYNIAHIMLGPFDRLEAELGKCQILCHVCHLSKTIGERRGVDMLMARPVR
jgi:5-methylcytosine-specific restriction endonuclease McrA